MLNHFRRPLLLRCHLLTHCSALLLLQSKADDFLALVTTTLRSYFSEVSREDDLPEEGSQEARYILALCGTLTSES